MNKFLKETIIMNENATTANGAKSYASIGTELLDQFGKCGIAMNRDYETVWSDQAKLWGEDPEMALRFIFYLRMITRKQKVGKDVSTQNTQSGQGLRDESLKRLLWLACCHEKIFIQNIIMIPIVGSWKDLWTLMYMYESDKNQLPIGFKLCENVILKTMAYALEDESMCDLIKKFMPRIQSEKSCTTTRSKIMNGLAKKFAGLLNMSHTEYRKFKASGAAHEFQQLISEGKFKELNFSHIPGIALSKMASSKLFENQGISDDYLNWINQNDSIKFNGYVFNLLKNIEKSNNIYNIATINKQFRSLIEAGKSINGGIKGNVLCALDTSGSMSDEVANGISAFDVCVSLGVYFSELNEGEFHNTVAMFDSESSLMKLSGEFCDKVKQIEETKTAWGSTNFQSLIDLIVRTRSEHPEISLSDFPQTLLVVSDMQFNPTSEHWNHYFTEKQITTNYEEAMNKLREVFPSEYVDNFKIIWWYCSGQQTYDYPSTMDDMNTMMLSGFDPSTISIVLGGEAKDKKIMSQEDIVKKVLNQEIFNFLYYNE